MKKTILLFLLFLPAVHSLCEATGTGKCYYVDPVNGNDANPGTSEQTAWKTFAPVAAYYKTTYQPPVWVALKPGDVLYAMDGLHNTNIHPGDGSGASGGGAYIAYFRSGPTSTALKGTPGKPITLKAYPGTHPIIGQNFGVGLYLEWADWWVVDGIEFSNSSNDCIDYTDSKDGIFENVEVHHCARAVTSGNPAGIKGTGAQDLLIQNSVFHDTLEMPVAGGLMRGVGIQLFRGSGVTVLNNTFYQTVVGIDATGKTYGPPICMFQKHAPDVVNGYLHIYNNTFTNCGGLAGAAGSSSQNTIVSGNVFYGSPKGITSKDYGGPTYQTNQLWEYNTFYNTGVFEMNPDWGEANPTTPYALKTQLDPPRNITFRNNIVYKSSQRVTTFDQYMEDAMYTRIIGEIHFDNNCYYTGSSLPTVGIAESNGGTYGTLGASYTWAQWQSQFGQDLNSVTADPLFVDAANTNFALQAGSPCAAMGAYAQGAGPVVPVCGDNVCYGAETCNSCSQDCGPCPVPPPQKTGDLNGDGKVDITDAQRVVLKLGQTNVNSREDLNADGTINIYDLVVLAQNWG